MNFLRNVDNCVAATIRTSACLSLAPSLDRHSILQGCQHNHRSTNMEAGNICSSARPPVRYSHSYLPVTERHPLTEPNICNKTLRPRKAAPRMMEVISPSLSLPNPFDLHQQAQSCIVSGIVMLVSLAAFLWTEWLDDWRGECAGGRRGWSVRGTAVCGLVVVVWACSWYGAGQLQSELQDEHRYREWTLHHSVNTEWLCHLPRN